MRQTKVTIDSREITIPLSIFGCPYEYASNNEFAYCVSSRLKYTVIGAFFTLTGFNFDLALDHDCPTLSFIAAHARL
tara:strand:- start:191 stop:421 length:231 start_codon:yes stop_codon:yes gene_type:complete